ncbi:MAG: lipid II flippase MurJ [Deltaproteobacteria bacterium]
MPVRLSLLRPIVIATFVALNITLSVAAQVLIVSRLGVGPTTDAVFAGFAVPQYLVTVVLASSGYVLVPMLSIQDHNGVRRTATAALLIGVTIFGGLSLLLALTAPLWIRATLPGFDAERLDLAVGLVRLQSLSLVTSALTAVLTAGCQALDRFVWSEGSAMLACAGQFAFCWFALNDYGPAAAALGPAVKGSLQALLLLGGLGGLARPAPLRSLAQAVWSKLRPLAMGAAIYKTDPIVDRMVISLAPVGSVSIFHIAQQVHAAMLNVVSGAISSPLLPALARLANAGHWQQFRMLARRRSLAVGLVALAGLSVFAVIGVPLVRYGAALAAISPGNASSLASTVLRMGGVLVFGAVGQTLSSTFYALGDTRTPARVGAVGFCVGVGCKSALFFAYGVSGFALGMSAYYAFNALSLAWFLRRDLRQRCAAFASSLRPGTLLP